MESIKSYYGSLNIYAELLDTIFKFYPDGIVCKDSELRYVNINNAYCNIFSLNDSHTLLNENENKFLSKQNRKLINDADNEILKTHYPKTYILNTEDNKILNITSSPIEKNSEILGIITCVKDITQEENLKEEFVNKHYQHLNAEKHLQIQRETFVASISHDLKNPTIAQIRGLELMLKGNFGNLTDEQRDILGMILDSCRYMSGMLSSLLATYRNYGGAIKLVFNEFSLSELVRECVSEMVYVARDKDINICASLCENSIVCADRVQIKRIIMNLISNGIKYAYKNTELKLRVKSDFENISFEFENKSPYLPEEKQKTIFARYVSYAGVHKELGIGLGLYASKKIAESHGGKIYVKSFKDDRNIFGFTIPVKQPNETPKKVFFEN